MLICQDTIYFGIKDSQAILPAGSIYKLQRNILFRSNEIYETDLKQKKKIETRVQYYSEAWNKAYNYSIKDTATQIEHPISSSEQYFRQFEGKIIRNIAYNAVDLFDGQVLDTTKYAIRSSSKAINKMHITTKKYVIRKNLRFTKHSIVNAQEISESERLIRNLDYIQDVRITIAQENLLSDSVDVTIITQDRLPIGINAHMSDYNEFSVTPYINNIAGTGDYLEAGFEYQGDESDPFGYTIRYKSQNISGSFIDAGAYRIINNKQDNYGITIERPFRTTEMELGGAFSFSSTKQNTSYRPAINIDTTITSPYESHSYDGWIGKTFKFSNTNEMPNISISGRYYDNLYKERPVIKSDSNLIFHDHHYILASAMVQKISFIQTRNFSGFGTTEDIPIGYSVKATSGQSWNNYFNRTYSGISLNYVTTSPKQGFISYSLVASTYFYSDHFEDSYIKYSTSYISPLYTLNRGSVRYTLSLGTELIVNERYYNTHSLSLREFDINHPYYRYNSLVSFQYKPIFHMPFTLLGFNFSMTPSVTLAYSSEDDFFSGHGDFFSVIGMDVRTKNESLIFPTLGMKIDYYPTFGDTRNKIGFSFYAKDTKLLESIFSPKPKVNIP